MSPKEVKLRSQRDTWTPKFIVAFFARKVFFQEYGGKTPSFYQWWMDKEDMIFSLSLSPYVYIYTCVCVSVCISYYDASSFVHLSQDCFSYAGSFVVPFPVAQMVKNLPAMQETCVWSWGQEDPLEKGIVTRSSILAWRIPWTEEPGRLYSQWSRKESDTIEWLTHILSGLLEFLFLCEKCHWNFYKDCIEFEVGFGYYRYFY